MADGDPELELEPEVDLDDDEALADADPVGGDEPAEEIDAKPQEQQATEPAKEQQEQQVRQPTRGENRFQALRNDNQRLAAELSDTRRRLDEISRRMEQPKAQESPEARAQRLALMTPEERISETLRESEQRMQTQFQNMQFQSADQASRTAFSAKATVDPLYAKYAPKVEAMIAEERAKGYPIVDRELVLQILIGRAALERRSSKEGKQEVRQAQRRVAAQRTRPINSGSDTQATRRQGESLERRLENMQI